jgi:hypothetical protein
MFVYKNGHCRMTWWARRARRAHSRLAGVVCRGYSGGRVRVVFDDCVLCESVENLDLQLSVARP